MNPAPIDCQTSSWIVSLQRDQQASSAQQQALNEHVQQCRACGVAYQQFSHLFRAMDALLGKDTTQAAPPLALK